MKSPLIILLLAFVFNSCQSQVKDDKTVKPFDYGKSTYGHYENNFFDFTLDFDTALYALNPSIRKSFYNDSISESLDTSNIKSSTIIHLLEYHFEDELPGSSFAILVSNTKSYKTGKSESNCYTIMKNSFEDSYIKYTFIGDTTRKELDGVSFIKQKATTNSHNRLLNQDIYVAKRNGFSMVILATYDNQEDKQNIEKVLASLKFE